MLGGFGVSGVLGALAAAFWGLRASGAVRVTRDPGGAPRVRGVAQELLYAGDEVIEYLTWVGADSDADSDEGDADAG